MSVDFILNDYFLDLKECNEEPSSHKEPRSRYFQYVSGVKKKPQSTSFFAAKRYFFRIKDFLN